MFRAQNLAAILAIAASSAVFTLPIANAQLISFSKQDLIDYTKDKARGIPRLMNQTAIDMLQPGDVLVVDLFSKKVNGTIVGDNLFYYVMKATHGGGLVVDGSIRDLDGLSQIDMPGYFKNVDP